MVLSRYALALLALGACTSARVETDITYDDRSGSYGTLDVYTPEGQARPRPAVLLIHGGSWRTGFKEQFHQVAERFAAVGYVAVTINYRLGPQGAFPAAAQDCACALSYVRTHADELGIDAQRVAVMGYSSGAHLAALLGVAANDPALLPDCGAGASGPPAAVVSAAGMQDLHDFVGYETVRDFLGGTPDDVPQAYDDASPLLHVDASEPPFLLIHGTHDVLVDTDQSVRMQRTLLAKGNDARLLLVEGGGHLFNPSDDGAETLIEIASDAPEAWLATIDFLDGTIGPP